jgi:hypothetical protein
MTKYTALSPSRHAGKTWSPPSHFGFAKQTTYVDVIGAEVAQVATNMPLALVRDGERFKLIGLLSYRGRHNVFVAPNGRWMGSYIPAAFRIHPFRLIRVSTPEKLILCVDETSGLIKDGGGQTLFDDAGQLSKSVSGIVTALQGLEKGRAVITVATRALEEAGIIVPWQIDVKGNTAGSIFEQLYRVDEPSLQGLDDANFLKLRKAGALALAYAQIVSMARVEFLEQLTAFHQGSAATASNGTTLADLLGDPKAELLNFNS